MATTTAFAFVGLPHPAHGGLQETHLIRLSEGSRPCFQIYQIERDCDGSLLGQRIGKWTSTLEHTLEDLLLMVAVLVEGDEDLKSAMRRGLPGDSLAWIESLSGLGDIRRKRLHAMLRARRWKRKLVLTVLKGSSIQQQLGKLRLFRLKCEVCASGGAEATA